MIFKTLVHLHPLTFFTVGGSYDNINVESDLFKSRELANSFINLKSFASEQQLDTTVQ